MKKNVIRLLGFWLNALSWLAPKTAGKKAFYLFCHPQRVPLKKYQLDFLNPAKLETFTTHGDTIQTYKWGNGKTKVLFVHGWRSNSFRWKKYITSLSPEQFSVYALDAPAHGLSSGEYMNVQYYGEVIEHFVNRLGGVDTIVSHSIGGFSSLSALYSVPDLRVKSLIVMGTPGQADEFVDSYKTTLGLTNRTMVLMTEYFKKKIGHDPSYFSAAKFAKALTIPGLIIHDTEDKEASVHNAYDIHDRWPLSSLIITKGFGHNLKSDDVIGYVQRFLEKKKVSAM